MVDRVIKVVHSFRHFENPQHIMTCLRVCGAWSRTQDFASLAGEHSIPRDLLEELEGADLQVYQVALQASGRFLTPLSWAQATLPLRMGGCGIQSVTMNAEATRVSSGPLLLALDRGSADVAEHRARPDRLLEQAYKEVAGTISSVLPRERALAFNELRGPYANSWLGLHATPYDGTLIGQPALAALCIAMATMV